MKALKSDLAKKVLADPKAREQLRSYVISTSGGTKPAQTRGVELRNGERTVIYRPVVVRKAA